MKKTITTKSTARNRVHPLISRFFYSVAFRALPRNLKFRLIHRFNLWSSEESISGPGSELSSTKAIRSFLERSIRDYKITSILDLPCGDFNWMKHVDLTGVSYLGGDIIPDLIRSNEGLYKTENVNFVQIDIIEDSLPKVDLIIVRDLFIHFNPENVIQSLRAICLSGSKYLLTTTWPDTAENTEIRDGYNFNINLLLPPYNLPPPLALVEESLDANSHRNCMGLWEVSSIYSSFRQQ